jgi:hypothetical protein
MKTLTLIFYNNILPIFLIVGLGFALKRTLDFEIKPISHTIFYILSPCLAFSSLYQSSLGGWEFWEIPSFVLVLTLVLWSISWAVTRALRLDKAMESAFLLTTLFVNAGNYGLSLIFLTFGEKALSRAVIYLLINTLLLNTAGVYLASRGRKERGCALFNILKVPLVYAASLAILLNLSHIRLPNPLLRAVNTIGKAAIPLMLLLLGMQLAKTPFFWRKKGVFLAASIRLVLAPILAFLLASWLGLSETSRLVCVVEASMPTAVMTCILASQFDLLPDFITSVVFLSTLASPLTLTLLIALVG